MSELDTARETFIQKPCDSTLRSYCTSLYLKFKNNGKNGGAISREILNTAAEIDDVDFTYERIEKAFSEMPCPLSINLSSVEAQPVSWLWPNFIPIGCATLISGDPGDGKTFFVEDVAARLSRGTRWIDGIAVGESANILFLSVEDDASNTIRPRFDSLGGDPACFWIYNTEQPLHLDLATPGGLERFENEIMRIGNIKLVVIDPIIDFSGDTNPNASEEVRALLTPLIAMAARLGFALVIIGHLNKSQAVSAIYRAAGSSGGWLGKCRAAFMIFRDIDDRQLRHVVALKANLAVKDPPQIEFRIVEGRIEGRVSSTEVDVNAHLNPDNRRRPREKASALTWLESLFTERDEIPATEIEEAANENGISQRTLARAKLSGEYLSKKSKMPDGKFQWVWVRTHAEEK